MKHLSHGVRNVMHMAERRPDPGSGGSGSELVGRDSSGRFVGADGNGSSETMARMKIAIPAGQQRWVEQEAARRGLPKTVIIRELLARVFDGGPPADADSAGVVGDPEYSGVVHDVDPVEHAGVHAGVHAGAGAAVGDGAAVAPAEVVEPHAVPHSGAPRVPEVEVMEPEGLHAGGMHAPGRRAGPHPRYGEPGAGAARAASPRGVSPYTDPSRQRVAGERVAVESVRSAVGDPSAGDSQAHMSHLPPGVGVPRARPAPERPAGSGEALDAVPSGVALPGGVHADVVSEGSDSKSLVLSGGRVAGESGVVVMLPGENPGDPMRAVRIPLASYVTDGRPGVSGGGFFSGIPRFLKYFLILFGVVSVVLGFVYLGSSLVASRYEFREVETAPGRVIFYRVDRWTGEMERCRSGVSGFRDDSDVEC